MQEYVHPDGIWWILPVNPSSFQVNELERELSRCTDEKHELVTERDVYRNKCDRLNNELNYVLHGDERKIVDIDTLIMEKKWVCLSSQPNLGFVQMCWFMHGNR